MNNKRHVDIILPVYNAKNFIVLTLKSIIRQTYKNWRLIIIDDCSNDGTSNILKKFCNIYSSNKILLIRNSYNRGQGFSRNLALKYAKSRYLAFIDADDLWKKNKLYRQLYFMQNNNYYFTYTDYITFTKKNLYRKIKVKNEFNYNNFVRDTSIATSTMMLNRDIIKNIQFPEIKMCEDYYFKCRILKRTKAIKLKGFFSKYRISNKSLQSNRFKSLYWVYFVNKNLNKMSFIDNLVSIFFIIINSFKKYAFR